MNGTFLLYNFFYYINEIMRYAENHPFKSFLQRIIKNQQTKNQRMYIKDKILFNKIINYH